MDEGNITVGIIAFAFIVLVAVIGETMQTNRASEHDAIVEAVAAGADVLEASCALRYSVTETYCVAVTLEGAHQ